MDFTSHLICAHQLADSTVYEYGCYRRRWQRWCRTRNLDPDQPSALRVRAWSATLPTGVSTRDNAKATIRHMCCWLGLDDVSGAVGRPEVNSRNLRMPLTRDEARRLMAHAWGCGDQGTTVIIALCTAMRISELSKFRWEHIDWKAGTVRFWRVKSRGWHTVPLAPQLAVRLQDVRPPEDTGYVLASRTDGYRSTQGLRNWIKAVASGAGLDWVQPHDLRRTAGRAAYEQADRDITVAQRFLGHSGGTEVTSRYIRADMDALRDTLDDIGDYWGWDDDGGDAMPEAA